MSESPISQLLAAIDELNVEDAIALMTSDIRMLAVDGRRAEGAEQVRDLLRWFFGGLRSTSHRVSAEWHQDNVWIAEVEADYELRDWLQLNALPRVFILRVGPEGIADLRVYGAHEQPLTDHERGEPGMFVGGRWVPPL